MMGIADPPRRRSCCDYFMTLRFHSPSVTDPTFKAQSGYTQRRFKSGLITGLLAVLNDFSFIGLMYVFRRSGFLTHFP